MKYLKIQNAGVLDSRLVALMGGTTKSKNNFKIGQFGTGLKYTLAYLLRENLDFKIFAGDQQIKIHTETETIQDQPFEIVCIDGHRTSITTNMGEDWEAWMIIRELWCNAIDEGEPFREVTSDVESREGYTTFYIQIDNRVQKVLDEWSKYFIHGIEPIFQNNEVALYPAGDHLCIYKQGVLIAEYTTLKGVFGYDMKNAWINELREFKGAAQQVIVKCLLPANEIAIRYFLENVSEQKHCEAQENFDWNWYEHFGQTWREVIGSAKIITKKSLDSLKERGMNPDEAGLLIVPHTLQQALSKQFTGIGATYIAGLVNQFYENYNEQLENRIKQGLAILETCDYFFHPELSFIYGIFEDKRILAQINLMEKKIYFSQQLLNAPLFDIVATLIEENEHFNTSLPDATREFQNHFIRLYTKSLLEKNEVQI